MRKALTQKLRMMSSSVQQSQNPRKQMNNKLQTLDQFGLTTENTLIARLKPEDPNPDLSLPASSRMTPSYAMPRQVSVEKRASCAVASCISTSCEDYYTAPRILLAHRLEE
jgi:hypothetical protein